MRYFEILLEAVDPKKFTDKVASVMRIMAKSHKNVEGEQQMAKLAFDRLMARAKEELQHMPTPQAEDLRHRLQEIGALDEPDSPSRAEEPIMQRPDALPWRQRPPPQTWRSRAL